MLHNSSIHSKKNWGLVYKVETYRDEYLEILNISIHHKELEKAFKDEPPNEVRLPSSGNITILWGSGKDRMAGVGFDIFIKLNHINPVPIHSSLITAESPLT